MLTQTYLVWQFGWVLAVSASGQNPAYLEIVPPQSVGIIGDKLQRVESIVNKAIGDGNMPGCVIAIGRHGKLAFLRAFGNRQIQPAAQPMTTDTVFDLASLTKPIATATSIMILSEHGKLNLDDRVAQHIPEFGNRGKQSITIKQLLTHQGGLTPDNPLADYDGSQQRSLARIYQLKTRAEPGSKFIYTDVGFIVLAELVERISGQNIHEFSQQHIFRPLGMAETGFLLPDHLRWRCAPTEKRDGHWMQGEVHDPRAYRLGGIAGHAGLFSTAQDLAVFAQMLVNNGEFGGKRIMGRDTVTQMTASYSVSTGTRGLGWDKRSNFSSNRGSQLSDQAFGHGGFTGTVLWIDPACDLFYIFLSNRLHPDGQGSVNKIAARIADVIVDGMNPAIVDADKQNPPNPPLQKGGTPVGHLNKGETNADPLQEGRKPSGGMQTGLDRLVADEFQLLQGKRVGLITNHTGIDRRGRRNVDLMVESENVNLVALFSPEHGIAGQQDSDVNDSLDAVTQLPIYSLYGNHRKPTKSQLDQIDCVVFDIQDIGTRFYTYISTMGLAMQAAAEYRKPFVVLDRPNPLGGIQVEGPLIDEGATSFVAFHNLPVKHGMTVGELAELFRHELQLNLDLHIVPVKGWRREQRFDETGLLWVNPSPNIRSLTQAMLYPGIGLLETTNVSVGRGTDTPFELVGAPWMDGQRVAVALNQLKVPGVTFVPRHFTPRTSIFAGERCGGVNIMITHRDQFAAIPTGITMAIVLRDLYPDQWQADRYGRLLRNSTVLSAIQRGHSFSEIQPLYRHHLQAFMKRRQAHLIYD